jgi:hypothetical protein
MALILRVLYGVEVVRPIRLSIGRDGRGGSGVELQSAPVMSRLTSQTSAELD